MIKAIYFAFNRFGVFPYKLIKTISSVGPDKTHKSKKVEK